MPATKKKKGGCVKQTVSKGCKKTWAKKKAIPCPKAVRDAVVCRKCKKPTKISACSVKIAKNGTPFAQFVCSCGRKNTQFVSRDHAGASKCLTCTPSPRSP